MPVCSVTLARICGAVGVVGVGDVDIFVFFFFLNSYFKLKLQAERTQKKREKRREKQIVVKNAFILIKLVMPCDHCPH